MSTPSLGESIRDEVHLRDLLSAPTDAAVRAMAELEGDILLLGAAGKMGPSLAEMTLRASEAAGVKRRVIAVSRFSEPDVRPALETRGIETLQGELLDDAFLESLPSVENVIYLVGMKFGTGRRAGLTWATNAYLPGRACQRFRDSRIVAFSTGNVYALSPADSRGSKETDALAPVGEYAMSALGRERIFEHFGHALGVRVALLRLNYAVEMRYGVLVDIALKVLGGEPIDLAMGYANVIWQGDANAMALCAFRHATSPVTPINLAGPDVLRVREVAERFGELLEKPVQFRGCEAEDALLSDGRSGYERLDSPQVPIDQVIRWTAEWLRRGGRTLDKPTHFQTRNGRF